MPACRKRRKRSKAWQWSAVVSKSICYLIVVGIVAPMAGREDANLLPVGHAPNLGMRPPKQTIPHLCKPLPDSNSV